MKTKRTQSLPQKTQPNIPQSQKKKGKNIYKVQAQRSQLCPQTSEEKQCLGKKIYKIHLHKMQFDYGRLQKPSSVKVNKYTKTQIDQDTKISTRVFSEYQSTRRITNILLSTNKQPIQLKNTQKKMSKYIKTQRQLHKTQPVAGLTPQNLSTVSRYASTQIITLQKLRAHTGLLKKEKQKKQMKSRVITVFVGGGGQKTKTICYPDTSDYQKLCNLN